MSSITLQQAETYTATVTNSDVDRFSALPGDENPIYTDQKRAGESRLAGRIVPGMLVGSQVSAALAKFPGDVIPLSENLVVNEPVRVGDDVTASVSLTESLGHGQYRLEVTVANGSDEPAVTGDGLVLLD